MFTQGDVAPERNRFSNRRGSPFAANFFVAWQAGCGATYFAGPGNQRSHLVGK